MRPTRITRPDGETFLLVAVMRKLLHAIDAMFNNHQTYDGSKLFWLSSISAQEVPSAPVIA